jgi:signal recognition particle subunit SRP54
MARKLAKGQFDLNDLAAQLQQMKKMGGLQGIMGMLPGVAKMKAQMAEANIDDRMILRQEAIISSMTKLERRKPDLLNASRKKRVAAGAGVEVQEINRLLKQHRQMADMVKSLAKGGRGNMQKMAAMMGGMGMGGGPGGMGGGGPDINRLKALGGGRMPEPTEQEMKALQDRLSGLGGGQMPGGLPGLPGLPKKTD